MRLLHEDGLEGPAIVLHDLEGWSASMGHKSLMACKERSMLRFVLGTNGRQSAKGAKWGRLLPDQDTMGRVGGNRRLAT